MTVMAMNKYNISKEQQNNYISNFDSKINVTIFKNIFSIVKTIQGHLQACENKCLLK